MATSTSAGRQVPVGSRRALRDCARGELGGSARGEFWENACVGDGRILLSAMSVRVFTLRTLCGGVVAAAALAAGGIERGNDPLRQEPEPLPVNQAFRFSAHVKDAHLVGRWRMPPGYYLYRHRLQVLAGEGVVLGPLATPPGKRITDEAFGETEVYYRALQVSAPIEAHPAGAAVSARFVYQGCAASGFCYPPQTRTVTLSLPAPAGNEAAAVSNVP